MSTRFVHLLFFLLIAIALQPLIIKAEELNGVKACQNRSFNQSECEQVGNGICCQWHESVGQCVSSIGHDICPGTETIPPPIHWLSTHKAMRRSMGEHSHRIVSEVEAESAPSTAPTKYDDRSCYNRLTSLDWYLCNGFNISQVATFMITVKISSVLSILGSSYIIQDVLRDPQKRNESTYHRIMLGLSCSDVIFSFIYLLGSWVLPKGSQLFAVGNDTTCSVAGFFTTMFSQCTPLYNCSLAIFYLLKLKFSWVDRKVKAVEKWLLFVPCTFGLIYAITTAAMARFGPYGYICMSYSPLNGYVYFYTLLFCLGFVSITMFLVYRTVRSVEKEAEKYTFARYNSSKTNTRSMSRRVMLQGVLYSAAIFLQSIVHIMFVIPALDASYATEILSAIIYPLQGFFNALIYIIPLFRQMMMKRRQDQHHSSRGNWWLITIWRNFSSQIFTSKESCNKSSTGGQIEVEGKCKEEEQVLDGCSNKVGVLKQNAHSGYKIDVNDNQEERMIECLNASSESKKSGNKESSEGKKTKGEESNIEATSSLMLPSSYVEDDDEKAAKSSFFASSQNSQFNKEEESHLSCFLSLEANTDAANEEGCNESNDESYVDDYLIMMKD